MATFNEERESEVMSIAREELRRKNKAQAIASQMGAELSSIIGEDPLDGIYEDHWTYEEQNKEYMQKLDKFLEQHAAGTHVLTKSKEWLPRPEISSRSRITWSSFLATLQTTADSGQHPSSQLMQPAEPLQELQTVAPKMEKPADSFPMPAQIVTPLNHFATKVYPQADTEGDAVLQKKSSYSPSPSDQ